MICEIEHGIAEYDNELVKVPYVKHCYHNKYLKHGINEIKMISDKFTCDGKEYQFEINSSTFQNYYTICYMAFVLNGGRYDTYHGYYHFDSWLELQDFVKSNYGIVLVKKSVTCYHRIL